MAQEPDQVTEGTIEPEQAGQDPALNPDFDPGGASDDLPYDAPDAPESEPAADPELGDPGPLEQEPATDIEVPVTDAGDEPAEPDVATPIPVATATPTPTPTPPATDPPVSSPPAAPDGEVTPPPAGPVGEAKAERERTRRDHEREQRSRSQASAPAPAAPAESVAATASSESAPPAEQPAPVLAVATRGSAKPGDRVHVVVAGESLWSIARDLLDANASTARVAREVNRLWELNRERIATGDPDLLMVGTELRLR